jgi:phosphoglycerate dehydrogenase-like enzyme
MVSSTKARKVVVTQRFFDAEAVSYLRSTGCDVVIAELPPGQADGDVPRETLLQWLTGAAGWIVGHARVTRDLLHDLPELQIISRRGVGYERVDVAAVRDLGRVATIAAGGNDATVADQVIGLMLALGRRFREGQQALSEGSWAIPLGTDISNPLTSRVTIDIHDRTVRSENYRAHFSLSARHHRMFLEGLDLVGSSLAQGEAIAAFEQAHWTKQPWLKAVAAATRNRLG